MNITAVVPAYNEAASLDVVLSVLTTYPRFTEVIVVDDGSTDTTFQIVKRYPVRYIRHEKNRGKGQAMETGVQAAQGDVIFFCDGDVRGLSHEILDRIILPVAYNEVVMFIGMIYRHIYFLPFILEFTPLLGGVRAIQKHIWHQLPAKYKQDFRPEAALNFLVRHYNYPWAYAVFPSLQQIIKEKKYGLLVGLLARCRMFIAIITTAIRVRRHYLR